MKRIVNVIEHCPDVPKLCAYREWCQRTGAMPLIFPTGILGTMSVSIRNGFVYRRGGRKPLGKALILHQLDNDNGIIIRADRTDFILTIERLRWRLLTHLQDPLRQQTDNIHRRIKRLKNYLAAGPDGHVYDVFPSSGGISIPSIVRRTTRRLSSLERLGVAENVEGSDILTNYFRLTHRIDNAHKRVTYFERLLDINLASQAAMHPLQKKRKRFFFKINGRRYLAYRCPNSHEGWPYPTDITVTLLG